MTFRVALVGMPNVGKTALFNKLTGSFQRVANFPGVTVEKKTGWISENGKRIIEVIDLPGIYSLDATTLDEKVTKDFLLQKKKKDRQIYLFWSWMRLIWISLSFRLSVKGARISFSNRFKSHGRSSEKRF